MLLVIYYCAAAVLLFQGLFHVLNHMDRHSCNVTRLAWLLMTTGALQVLLAPIFGATPMPTFGDVLLLGSVAGYFIANHTKGTS
ncbi:MAG: hypothetical protein K2P77_05080 [Burkholderiaceae bacterium]|nr:hypothetical protein [Burkholderiaceae bacterium]